MKVPVFCFCLLLACWSCNFKKIEVPQARMFARVVEFGDQYFYFPKSMICTSDDGYVISGFSESNNRRQAFLVRLNNKGEVIWPVQNLGGLKTEGRSAVATSDGGFLLCGYSIQETAGSETQLWVAKFDADGNATQHSFGAWGRTEAPFGIVPASGGNFIIGFTASGAGTNAIRYLLINSNGDSLQDRQVNSTKPFPPLSMIKTANGDVALTGFDMQSNKTMLLITGENGQALSALSTFSAGLVGQALAELPDEGLAVAGYSFEHGGDFYLNAVDKNGLSRWAIPPQFPTGPYDDELWTLHPTHDSQLLVLGYSADNSGVPELYWSKRSSTDGSLLGQDRRYSPSQRLSVIGGDFALCADDGFAICAGLENSPGTLLILKTDPDGNYQ